MTHYDLTVIYVEPSTMAHHYLILNSILKWQRIKPFL